MQFPFSTRRQFSIIVSRTEYKGPTLNSNRHQTMITAGDRIDESTGHLEIANKIEEAMGSFYTNLVIREYEKTNNKPCLSRDAAPCLKSYSLDHLFVRRNLQERENKTSARCPPKCPDQSTTFRPKQRHHE